MRKGFSIVELVFVIVILGILAAVAIPKFITSRTDANVASARSDMSSAQKVIVAKIFTDNISATGNLAPDPNKKASEGGSGITWGKWIMEVANLNGSKWGVAKGYGIKVGSLKIAGNEERCVEPLSNTKDANNPTTKSGCGDMLGIHQNGYMVFAPNNLKGSNLVGNTTANFCYTLKQSYASSGDEGNRIIPLAASGTVEY